MFRFSRKPFAILTLALLTAIVMIFSETSVTSAQVTSSQKTAIHVSITHTPSPVKIGTNDKNAPPPSNDHIIYVTTSSGAVTPNLVINCGFATCSLYFSRYQTNEIAVFGPGIVLSAGIIPGSVGFILKLGAQFVQERAQQASNLGSCLRVRFIPPAVPVGLYIDNSGFCHNN